jgi:peptide/nickel transport system ATP-binding protein/oligopeptide transport system ATP-binding protein
VEPPLLQIGRRHKVACHFAGEIGQHPSEPVTAPLLGVDRHGEPLPGATPAPELGTDPGYADTWYDFPGRRMCGTTTPGPDHVDGLFEIGQPDPPPDAGGAR